MMRFSFLFILVLSASVNLFATAQSPDILILGKDTFKLFSNPLEDYIRLHPEWENRIFPKFNDCGITHSSGCLRKYIATWEIKNRKLYLVKIGACMDCIADKGADLELMFGDKFQKGRVYADWYSGNLEVPKGEKVEHIHAEYMSIYQRKLFISVRKGKVFQKSQRSYLGYQRQKTNNEFTEDLKGSFMRLLNEEKIVLEGSSHKGAIAVRLSKQLKVISVSNYRKNKPSKLPPIIIQKIKSTLKKFRVKKPKEDWWWHEQKLTLLYNIQQEPTVQQWKLSPILIPAKQFIHYKKNKPPTI
ncbi:MAG: hypothetical protein GY810_02385 [Aureispira sp.]|nr:hypothetical protein [Aureispira sp.]